MCVSEESALYGFVFFFFQAEDGIRDLTVTGVQTCALPIFAPVGKDIDEPLNVALAEKVPVARAGALAINHRVAGIVIPIIERDRVGVLLLKDRKSVV